MSEITKISFLETANANIVSGGKEDWFIIPRGLKDVVLAIDRHGHLTLGGNISLLDPRVVQAFYEATNHLRELGISIPGPDPAFFPIEQKLNEISENGDMSKIEPGKVRQGDDVIIIIDGDYQHVNPSGETVVYIGQVISRRENKSTQGNNFKLSASGTRVHFHYYTPTTQHITGIHPQTNDFSVSVLFDHDNPNRWGYSISTINSGPLQSLNKEIADVMMSRSAK